jgi:hypothetical protein
MAVLGVKSKVYHEKMEEMSKSSIAEDVECYNLLNDLSNVGVVLFNTLTVHATSGKVRSTMVTVMERSAKMFSKLSFVKHDPWEDNSIAIMFDKSFKSLVVSHERHERPSVVDQLETADGSVKRTQDSVDGMQHSPHIPRKKKQKVSEKSKSESH